MDFSDVILKQKLKEGDYYAFEHLFKIYHTKLFSFALRFIKDKQLALEIVMDVFLNFWNHKENAVNINNIESYLVISTRNQCLNKLRSKDKILNYYTDSDLQILEYEIDFYNNDRITEKIFSTELQQELERIINLLPHQQQLVFKLSRIEGLSSEKIAKELNLSKRTVETHIYVALKFIKEKLIFFFS